MITSPIRLLVLPLFLLLLTPYLVIPVAADEGLAGAGAGIEEEYRDYLNSIPEDVADHLPEGLFPEGERTDFARVSEAVAGMSGFSYLMEVAGEVLSVEWGTAWRTLARTTGLLLVSAVAGTLCRTFRSDMLSRTLSPLISCVLLGCSVETLYGQLEKVSAFLASLTQLTTALLPLMTALHVMGGNVAVAAAQNGSLMLFLTVCENVCGRTVLPTAGLCLALAVTSTLSSGISMKGMTALVKNGYTKTLGFVMLLLSFTMSTQTVLRAASDSLSARTAKFVAGNLIPVVGGALGDTFRTVASGVAFLKGTVGVGAMIVLFVMLLPVLISLLLTRLSLRLSQTAAELLGCDSEGHLLGELIHIYGLLIAVVSLCSVLLIFALTLFVRVSAA